MLFSLHYVIYEIFISESPNPERILLANLYPKVNKRDLWAIVNCNDPEFTRTNSNSTGKWKVIMSHLLDWIF